MEGEDWRARIPAGFRFIPTDDELLQFYLVPKLMGQALPCGIVTEADVYKHHAQELLGTNHEAYFFTSRNRKYPNGKRPDRKAGGGFWKSSSSNKDIKAPDNSLIGQKKTLTYYIDDETSKGRKTDWLMVEYIIPSSQSSLQDEKLDTWIVCKVYSSNREKNTNGGAVSEDQAIGSSSHYVVHEDTKGPIGLIDSSEQDGPSRLGQDPPDSQPLMALPPPLPSAFSHIPNNSKQKESSVAKAMEGEDWRLRIPPGFRFVPADDELLLFYLLPKLMGQPLPCGIVMENEVYKYHPQELLGTNHEAYFFTPRNRKYPNGKRPDRKAGGGYWKASSSNKEIKAPDDLVIGHRRTLAYHIDDGTPKGRKTNWLMVEYTIPHTQLPLQDKQLDTWVICKVYLNNREKNPNGGGAMHEDQATESSSHSIVNDDTKHSSEIDSLQQDMITSKRVRVWHDGSNHVEEQACMQSSPPYSSRDMSPCMEMPSYVPPRLVAYAEQCSPSRLGQGPAMSNAILVAPTLTPRLDFSAPPLPSTGYAEAEASTFHISPEVSAVTSQYSDLRDISQILSGIEANPDAKYFYSVEEKLKEVLGDSWLEDL